MLLTYFKETFYKLNTALFKCSYTLPPMHLVPLFLYVRFMNFGKAIFIYL